LNEAATVKQTETVTFRLTPEEKETLLKYCELTARTQSDVFREFLRTLQKKLSKRGVLNPPL
jgi:predicted DNA-binding protein